ncbi:MAG: thioredoxin TrxC [Desulfobacterales bacterium]|nr:thioredoxin TrxC [Desulfobacterales bacterium]
MSSNSHEGIHITCPHCDTINRLQSDRPIGNSICGKCKQPMFIGKPITLTTDNFYKHINNHQIPVLVDFFADWCGPCKMMAPIIDQAARELEPKIRLAKINTDQERSISETFQIVSVPTLILFNQGKEALRNSGALNLSALKHWLVSYLSDNK